MGNMEIEIPANSAVLIQSETETTTTLKGYSRDELPSEIAKVIDDSYVDGLRNVVTVTVRVSNPEPVNHFLAVGHPPARLAPGWGGERE